MEEAHSDRLEASSTNDDDGRLTDGDPPLIGASKATITTKGWIR